jgi:hypothetical protein
LKDKLDAIITGNIPFIKDENSIETDIIKLYTEWHPKFRYEVHPLVNEERIKRLLFWAKKTRTEILNHI